MQNKGFVKVFAVLLTLVCMFYLSFSFVTRHYNSKAAEYAGGESGKREFLIWTRYLLRRYGWAIRSRSAVKWKSV